MRCCSPGAGSQGLACRRGARTLTRCEANVLFWVAAGKTNAAIATILGLSRLTVRTHLEHIYQKLGVETRTAATVRALTALGLRSE